MAIGEVRLRALRQMSMTRILHQTHPEPLKTRGLGSGPARSENLIGSIDDLRFMICEIRSRTNSMNKPYDLEERLIDFAVDVIDVVEVLPNSKAGNHIANQQASS